MASAATLSSTISVLAHLTSEIQPSSSLDHRLLNDLQQLNRTFRRIQALLHDADKREIEDESVNLWLSELKDVAYDAEDVLDEFNNELLRAQVESSVAITSEDDMACEHVEKKKAKVSLSKKIVQTLFKFSCNKGFKLEQVYREKGKENVCRFGEDSLQTVMIGRIKDINSRLCEIAEARNSLFLREEDGRRSYDDTKMHSPPTSHLVNELNVYGREDDTKKVIEILDFRLL